MLVSHKCSKLLGVESTWDQGKFDAAVDYHLKQKLSKPGSAADICVCYHYLKGKPKWNAFQESQVNTNDKHNIPHRKEKKSR
jgi:hypothetical protein